MGSIVPAVVRLDVRPPTGPCAAVLGWKFRALARLRGTTLNEEFRKWLASYSREDLGGLKLAQTRAMLDELAAPITGKPFVPLDYRFAPAAQRVPLRERGGAEDNEREARILQRLDGAGA